MLHDIDIEEIKNECMSKTPMRILETIREHRMIAKNALDRIKTEGIVVRTLKGDVIQHPAITIHAASAKAEALLIKEWGKI